MLEIRDLRAHYGGTDVLRGISLNVEPGEFLCVAGPNGCGKSTLLKAVARLLPCRGTVAIRGRDAASLSRRALAREIALLFQSSPLAFPYTVYDTVAMGAYARRRNSGAWFSRPGEADRTKIEETLCALGIAGLRDKSIGEVSGGELQLAFLARTLVQNPRIILLDEPTNHLDLKHQIALLDHLATWLAAPLPSPAAQGGTQGNENETQSGRAVIAVFHDLNLALRYGRRTALMAEGKIAAWGASAEVFSGPALEAAYGMDVRRFMRESLENWR